MYIYIYTYIGVLHTYIYIYIYIYVVALSCQHPLGFFPGVSCGIPCTVDSLPLASLCILSCCNFACPPIGCLMEDSFMALSSAFPVSYTGVSLTQYVFHGHIDLLGHTALLIAAAASACFLSSSHLLPWPPQLQRSQPSRQLQPCSRHYCCSSHHWCSRCSS